MRSIDILGMQKPAVRDPGPVPDFAQLSIDRLVVDEEYQRPIGKDGRKAIERIAAKFEWTKFSTVVVAPISGGRYAIIDGQHRTTAAKLIGIREVPCQVVSLDRAGQAAAFSAINGSVTKITAWNIYKAALAANEGWATACRRTTEAAGCRLMTYNKSANAREAGELYGVNTMRELIERHGEGLVTTALTAYRKSVYGDLPVAWGNVYVVAWIAAVAQCMPASLKMGAERLSTFHDTFDLLEHDDVVTTNLRLAKREGKPTPAHWDALSNAIGAELVEFCKKEAA